MSGADPRAIVESLNDWARRTDWVDWVELGGSLGRGAGDEFSDVDAGIGVREADRSARSDDERPVSEARIAEARSAVESFAPVAASLTQPLDGRATHLVCVYEDGRQLSLVVFDADVRTGLPPQARATVDKSGRLRRPLDRSRWDADDATVREWTFLAWLAIGDAARHRHRGRTWRAMQSLTEARDHLWRLWAHRLGLVYPGFGAVTVENADAELPPDIEDTHPPDLGPEAFHRALTAIARLLEPYTAGDLRALAETARSRLALLAD
ncbi:hypothetical protein K3N28_17820 [Glycomyces sp. TRM65418]|uniref:hypothetical protein n=1 Tax=Glycomyces sp. TRM65418 TaxID=2867006 RepID=UPI001CE555E3|nr:hypothetical protein [Glycomyces sp. TRM65418]MCC3764919.1 hypothetical protein [Glycomyces sp. TRM65418]QZD54560.1 hypothetical protein K3N28_17730 [Glycomyces sp. TRM65418]